MSRNSHAKRMNEHRPSQVLRIGTLILIALSVSSCGPGPSFENDALPFETPTEIVETTTPYPERPRYDPGQLVPYTARAGDSLPALAARFNTSIEEIREANTGIPLDVTTLPPGMPMQIPIYYRSFWGSPFPILPDNLFVNGPSATSFDCEDFVANHPGWLKDFRTYAQGAARSGAEVVNLVATNYSIDPRLLLAVMEYRNGALSDPLAPEGLYPLGIRDYHFPTLYMQLIWVANILNHGYYGWRTGLLTEFEHPDGSIERPDPWQTAASVALQYFFSRPEIEDDYTGDIRAEGFQTTYADLFGDPWLLEDPHIPVSLQQPSLSLPFLPGETWAYTGGPHTGWGTLFPWAGIDFAPASDTGGCSSTDLVSTAMAEGVVTRSETGVVMLDLDGDGDERTGWNLLYLHVATTGRAALGEVMKTGDVIGYPSCEGGTATGTHVHIARKFNGEWMPADGVIPFNLEGWVAQSDGIAYEGTLTRGTEVVIACACSDFASQLQAGK